MSIFEIERIFNNSLFSDYDNGNISTDDSDTDNMDEIPDENGGNDNGEGGNSGGTSMQSLDSLLIDLNGK